MCVWTGGEGNLDQLESSGCPAGADPEELIGRVQDLNHGAEHPGCVNGTCLCAAWGSSMADLVCLYV